MPEPVPSPPAPLLATLRDAALVLPGRVFPAATTLALAVLGSRWLSAAELGLVGLAVTTAQVGAMAIGGWLDQATLRFLPSRHAAGTDASFAAENGYLWRRVAVGYAAGALVTTAVLKLLAPAWFPLGALALALCFLQLLFSNSQMMLIATRSPGRYSSAEAVRFAVSLAGMTASQALWPGNGSAWIASLAVGLAAGLASSGVWSGFLGGMAQARRSGYIREAVSYGLPVVGWLVCAYLLGVVDRYFLLWFHGQATVGVYFANAQFLPAVALLVASPMLYAAHAQVMRASEMPDGEAVRLAKVYQKAYVRLNAPIAIAFAVAAPWVTPLALGADMAAGTAIVPVLIAANFVWGLAVYVHKPLELAKATRTLLWLVLGALAFKLVVGLAATAAYGMAGAAFTTLLAYGLYAATAAWKVSRPG